MSTNIDQKTDNSKSSTFEAGELQTTTRQQASSETVHDRVEELTDFELVHQLRQQLEHSNNRLNKISEHYDDMAAEYYDSLSIVQDLFMLDGITIPNIHFNKEHKCLFELLEQRLKDKKEGLEIEKLNHLSKIRQIEVNQRVTNLQAYKDYSIKVSDLNKTVPTLSQLLPNECINKPIFYPRESSQIT